MVSRREWEGCPVGLLAVLNDVAGQAGEARRSHIYFDSLQPTVHTYNSSKTAVISLAKSKVGGAWHF